MNEGRVKGAVDEVMGTLKEKTGELRGNTPLRIKGIAQPVKGKLENTWGKTKDAVNETSEESRTQNGEHTIGSGPFRGAVRRQ